MVIIKKNPNGDTRSASKDVTLEEFRKANEMHIQDVKNVLYELAYYMMAQGRLHDVTKISHEEKFFEDFKDALNNGTNFTEGWWYNNHIKEERHHPMAHCCEDINLLDIIEMVVDCNCAGLARTGNVFPVNIDPEILKKAVENTSKLIKTMVKVED